MIVIFCNLTYISFTKLVLLLLEASVLLYGELNIGMYNSLFRSESKIKISKIISKAVIM